MKKLVIIGGGIAGLVCSYVMNRVKGLEVTVLEPGEVGGEFLSGGLKYIHHTQSMENLFDELDLPWSHFVVKGGILLRGVVRQYPNYLREIGREQAARIQRDHYRKTRRIEPGPYSSKAMNDPAAVGPKKALRCHFPEFIESMAKGVDIVQESCLHIGEDFLITNKGRTIFFDYAVLTAPLWVIKNMVSWHVPSSVAMELNIAIVEPRKDRFYQWDYVYTPYTPGSSIHRLSPDGNDYAVEANGQLDYVDFINDLNFLFSDGWHIKTMKNGLKGHLLPLSSQPEPPKNISLLGRFACWDTRMTVDVVMEHAIELSERWFA
jgi:hypothetical protein